MKMQIAILCSLLTYLCSIVAAFVMRVQLLVVTSNSMKPAFEFGDVLLAQSQEHYALEDIISFSINNNIATHRIISIHKQKSQNSNNDTVSNVLDLQSSKFTDFFQTKGDANLSADLHLISQKQVIGKVITVIPRVGFIILFLKSKHMAQLLVLGIVVLLINATTKKVRKFLERKHESNA